MEIEFVKYSNCKLLRMHKILLYVNLSYFVRNHLKLVMENRFGSIQAFNRNKIIDFDGV